MQGYKIYVSTRIKTLVLISNISNTNGMSKGNKMNKIGKYL